MPNVQKSAVFFSRVEQTEKVQIMSILGFQEGALPIKYLGLPLISTKLKKDHCQDLISKITTRVSSWTTKTLSYAGRIQLVNSGLVSMHVYWCLIFLLPKAVVHEVERICRNFLWHGSDGNKRGGQVAWNEVCQQKVSGGLGIKPLTILN